MNADSSTIDLTPALSWLKRVAGIDDAYIARWPEAAWVEWARAMYAGIASVLGGSVRMGIGK